MTVSLPKFGTTLLGPDGPQFLLSFCGHGETRAMYCGTCRFAAPNPAAMREHCKLDGEHEVVSWCAKHRIYETVPPKGTP
jgi:hypothetical protein